MKKLIDINNYPVSVVLNALVKDKTTGRNIIFASTITTKSGIVYGKTEQITATMLRNLGSNLIQPRVAKSLEAQSMRTRDKAEVFTPSWICNKMNNHCDAEWFGRENVFNVEDGQSWKTTTARVKFVHDGDWQKYVDSKRIEITCGEAPYVVSRYDSTTAEIIPVKNRIGILDRKLRVVNENTDNEEDWLKWTYRAFQSVYGYEYQGDNLLIARINLLVTFVDYMKKRWNREPTDAELRKVANVIVWNFWQMDGITGTVPFGNCVKDEKNPNIFDFAVGENENHSEEIECRIFDWTRQKSLTYRSIKGGRKNEV